MDHVGLPVEHSRDFQRGAGEEREAMAVVGMAVDGLARAEVVMIVDQEDFEAVEGDGVDSYGFVAPVEGQEKAGDAGPARDAVQFNRAVPGDGAADVESAAGEGLGERGEHVGQTAGLGEGVEIGRDHEDAGLGRGDRR